MYRRNASAGVLPTTGGNVHGSSYSNGAYTSPGGSGYRPNYPVPPNYASGISMPSGSVDSKSRKKTRSTFMIPQWIYWILIFILAFFLVLSRGKIARVQRKLERASEKKSRFDRDKGAGPNSAEFKKLQREYENERRKADASQGAIAEIQQKNIQLEAEKTELMLELEHHKHEHHGDEDDEINAVELANLRESMKKLEKREDALLERITGLQDRIQRESSREVVERFGAGPHYIQFNVRLPENLITDEFPEISSFVVKLASVNDMPHSIHLFLEQVQHNLWDGCSFVINAFHILQVGPHSFASKSNLLNPFKEKKLDKVAFQEYSKNHPHGQYTLGFAGRPGGPDFYFNKIDNTQNHGPGGQEHHALDEEADPSFAKVVDGFSVIDMLFKLPTRGAQNILKDQVEIDTLQLLQNYEESSEKLRSGGSKEVQI